VPEDSRPDFAISTEGKWSPVTRAHSSLSALSLPIKRESLRRDLPPISTLCKFFIVIYLSSVPTLSKYSPLSSSPPSSLFVGFFLVYYLSRRGLIEANFCCSFYHGRKYFARGNSTCPPSPLIACTCLAQWYRFQVTMGIFPARDIEDKMEPRISPGRDLLSRLLHPLNRALPPERTSQNRGTPVVSPLLV
jgi:hypothetical protein